MLASEYRVVYRHVSSSGETIRLNIKVRTPQYIYKLSHFPGRYRLKIKFPAGTTIP
jgi:hypothetical protein